MKTEDDGPKTPRAPGFAPTSRFNENRPKTNHDLNHHNVDNTVRVEEISQDAAHIRQFALHTPLIHLPWLSTETRTVWAKLECNQITNSFKIRGAFNAIRKLPSAQLASQHHPARDPRKRYAYEPRHRNRRSLT